MYADDFRDWLRQRPFRPFRFLILERTGFEVVHPELVIVAETVLHLHVRDSQGSGALLAERRVTIDLLHITRLEELPAPPIAAAEP